MMDKDVAKALLTLSKSIDGVIVQMFAEIDKFDDQGLQISIQRFSRKFTGFYSA